MSEPTGRYIQFEHPEDDVDAVYRVASVNTEDIESVMVEAVSYLYREYPTSKRKEALEKFFDKLHLSIRRAWGE